MCKFVITRDHNRKFHFKLQASNGQTILESEGYKAKANAKAGIASVKVHCRQTTQMTCTKTMRGKHMLILRSANGFVIASSPEFATSQECESALGTVRRVAPSAGIVDQTERV